MDKTNKIIHKRSSVILENGKAKLPTTDQLEYGELAINFAKGAETISFKNNNDEIVSITTSTALEDIIESNMQNVQASIDGINQTIDENEEIIAAALTDLDERINSTGKVIEEIQNENATLESRIDGKLADKADKTTVEAIDDRVEANESEIAKLKGLEQAYKDADDVVRGEFAAADATLKTELEGKIEQKANKEEVENQITALDERVTDLVTEIENNEETTAKALTDLDTRVIKVYEDFATADTALKTELEGEIGKKANQSDFTTLAGRVDVVQGEDTGKSMRTVAAEEAAKEVAKVVADANADFDTLKEVADWILNDTTGAAGLQNDVAELKDVVKGYEGESAIKTVVDTLAGRVTANEGTISGLTTTVSDMDAAYKAADTKIREDFATADTALEGRVDTKLAGKVDKSTVDTIDDRLTDLEEGVIENEEIVATALTDLDERLNNIPNEFAAADTALKDELTAAINKKADAESVAAFDSRISSNASAITALQTADTKIREDFTKADTDLKNELNGAIANKADKSAIEAIDTRLTDLETGVINDLNERVISIENVIEENEEITANLFAEMDTRIIELEEKLKDADIDGGEF